MEGLEIVFNYSSIQNNGSVDISWQEFEDKSENKEKCTKPFTVLEPEEELDITVHSGLPTNLIIEGDNFQSLQILNLTHHNNIDAIYIDPPYNSGNTSLSYTDKFYQKKHFYRHRKWLAFMYDRLNLCKDLLVDDGVIFISIDDRELAHLKLLCDRIFGERNYLGNFIWINRTTPNDSANNFAIDHEYILTYAKNKDAFKFIGIEKNLSNYINKDDDPNGSWMPDNPTAASGANKDRFAIKNPYTHETYLPPAGRYWAFSKKRVNEWHKSGKLIFPTIPGKKFLLKKYLKELKSHKKPVSSVIEGMLTAHGTKELKQIFKEGSPVKYPKPISLIKLLFKSVNKKNGCFLDFFAGTGTSGQAILELNQNDGGNRKFILCNNNENNLCREVLYQRIKKNIEGYQYSGNKTEVLFEYKMTYSDLKQSKKLIQTLKTIIDKNAKEYDSFRKSLNNSILTLTGIKQKPIKIPGLPGNVRYYKSKSVGSGSIAQRKELILKNCTELIRIKENAFEIFTIADTYGIYGSKIGIIAIYFDLDVNSIPILTKQLQGYAQQIKIYLFSVNNLDNLTKEFSNYKVETIPSEILELFQLYFTNN